MSPFLILTVMLSCFLWWCWGTDGGHQWVCDGYRAEADYCRTNLWFHMNWGWDGRNNGLFFQSEWAPTATINFDYQQQFIHNIYPSCPTI